MVRIVSIGANLKDWKKKKKKQSERADIKDKLDKLVNILVRQRAGYKCERCGDSENLNTVHIFSRNNLATRWDMDNVLCGCAGCHFWAHQNPLLFTKFVRQKLGDKYERLKKKSISIKKWEVFELEELIKKFKEEINE